MAPQALQEQGAASASVVGTGHGDPSCFPGHSLIFLSGAQGGEEAF